MKTGNLIYLGVLIAMFLQACGGAQYDGRPTSEQYTQDALVEEQAKSEQFIEREMEDDGVLKDDEPGTVDHNTEEYDKIVENEFKDVKQNPLSTFSIDVDNAAYTNVRRFINSSQLPPPNAVRIEEMINYFDYDYPDATGEHPFTFVTETSVCPWNAENHLVHIGIQGKKLNYEDIRPSNLVFLIDASGSMDSPNKLPLMKSALKILLEQLDDRDRIAMVAYAGAAGLVLESTPATEKRKILKALDKIEAGGSTAGGAGIELAYKVAQENLIADGNNRIILATDGDFNVGTSSTGSLVDIISEKRKMGIYLTILGLGMGNYKDGRMEQISNAGNGNYFYIDNIKEAEKVFVKDMRANLFTIAKDVKIQIEFNPTIVKAYRLIGYENRVMAAEDFDDDTKDAGELGAGHSVTALYEVVPHNSSTEVRTSEDLKYQESNVTDEAEKSGEIMTIKFRYKPIDSDVSTLIEHPILNNVLKEDETSNNFRWAAAVAEFGLLLRDSQFKGESNYEHLLEISKSAKGKDESGYRQEFISLADQARLLSKN